MLDRQKISGTNIQSLVQSSSPESLLTILLPKPFKLGVTDVSIYYPHKLDRQKKTRNRDHNFIHMHTVFTTNPHVYRGNQSRNNMLHPQYGKEKLKKSNNKTKLELSRTRSE